MKKNLLFLLLIILVLITACKESTTGPTTEIINDDYFPIINGSAFIYSLVITDSTGANINGNRITHQKDTSSIGGTIYFTQKDSFNVDLSTIINSSFIRKTNSGVFSFADTTGLSSVIPDSLKKLLSIDREVRLLYYPLALNQNFPVYKISVSLAGINVVDLNAKVESEENLNLTLDNAAIQLKTFKIKYDLTLRLGLNASDEIKYEAYGWAAKDVGFVKWDGHSEVLNVVLNGNIFPQNTKVKLELTSYNIP